MKLSKKQKQEIDFLSTKMSNIFTPTEKEIEEYIDYTVNGKGKIDLRVSNNRLFLNKRSLEISYKMWREDIPRGIFNIPEMQEDFNHPYANRLAKMLIKDYFKSLKKGDDVK